MTAVVHDPAVAHAPGFWDLDCPACVRSWEVARAIGLAEPVDAPELAWLDRPTAARLVLLAIAVSVGLGLFGAWRWGR